MDEHGGGHEGTVTGGGPHARSSSSASRRRPSLGEMFASNGMDEEDEDQMQADGSPDEMHMHSASAYPAGTASASSVPVSPSRPSASSSSSSSPSFFSSLAHRALSSLAAHRADSAARSLARAAGLTRVAPRLLLWAPTQTTIQEAVKEQKSSGSGTDKEEMTVGRKQVEALSSYLSTYHSGSCLLVDVCDVLSSCGCGEGMLSSSRMRLDFGSGVQLHELDGDVAGNKVVGMIGTLHEAAHIVAAVLRWWAADDENVVVVAAIPTRRAQMLAACILYASNHTNENTSFTPHQALRDASNEQHSTPVVTGTSSATTSTSASSTPPRTAEATKSSPGAILSAMQSVLQSYENRIMAQLHVRSLEVAQKQFLQDFQLIHAWDPHVSTDSLTQRTPSLTASSSSSSSSSSTIPPSPSALPASASASVTAPRVYIHDLLIHRVPQMAERGVRLQICLIANGNNFLYTTQAHGGGHVYVPTTLETPLTVRVPICVTFAGVVHIKIWHQPDHASTHNPRQLICETRVHSAVLALPCFKLPDDYKHEGSVTIPPNGRQHNQNGDQQHGSNGTSPPEDSRKQSLAFVAADGSAVAEGSDDWLGPSSPSPHTDDDNDAPPLPTPYPIHRLHLRKDELILSDPSEQSRMMSESDEFGSPSTMYPLIFHKGFGLEILCTPLDGRTYTGPAAAAFQHAASIGAEHVVTPNNKKKDASPATAPRQPTSSSSPADGTTDSLLHTRSSPPPPEQDLAICLPSSPSPPPHSSAFQTPPRRPNSHSRTFAALPSPRACIIVPSLPAPPVPRLARHVRGVRWFYESKHGHPRPETESERETRLQSSLEHDQLDAMYGRGMWRRDGGILYTATDGGGLMMYDASSLSLQQLLEHHAAHYRAAHASQAQAEAAMHVQLIAQHQQSEAAAATAFQQQQLQQQQRQQRRREQAQAQIQTSQPTDHQQQQASIAPRSAADALINGRTLQEVLTDPNSNQLDRDEALARMLQAQYEMEEQQHFGFQPQVVSTVTPMPESGADVAQPPQSQSQSQPHLPSPSDSSSAATTASDTTTSADPNSHTQFDADEAYARELQRQLEAEAQAEQQPRRLHRQSQQQSQQPQPQLVTAGQYGPEMQALHSQLQRLQMRSQRPVHYHPPHHHHYRSGAPLTRLGASMEQIGMLPVFTLSDGSKYLQESCLICCETYQKADVLRQMQCMHAYHRQCIDQWLMTKAVCPVCKTAMS